MPLCFIEPQDAIRIVADSVGREARRQLLERGRSAWVDEIPDDELVVHYSKAVDDLDEDDLSMLAAWHASLEVGQPIANKEFLLGASTASASTGARRSRSPRGSAATRRSRTASRRSRRSTPSCPWLSEDRAWSSRRKPSSSTAGTAWAPRLGGCKPALPASSVADVRRTVRSLRPWPAWFSHRVLVPTVVLLIAGCSSDRAADERVARRRLRACHQGHRRRHAPPRRARLGPADRDRHAGGLRRRRVLRARGVHLRQAAAAARHARALPGRRRGARPLRPAARLRLASATGAWSTGHGRRRDTHSR